MTSVNNNSSAPIVWDIPVTCAALQCAQPHYDINFESSRTRKNCHIEEGIRYVTDQWEVTYAAGEASKITRIEYRILPHPNKYNFFPINSQLYDARIQRYVISLFETINAAIFIESTQDHRLTSVLVGVISNYLADLTSYGVSVDNFIRLHVLNTDYTTHNEADKKEQGKSTSSALTLT